MMISLLSTAIVLLQCVLILDNNGSATTIALAFVTDIAPKSTTIRSSSPSPLLLHEHNDNDEEFLDTTIEEQTSRRNFLWQTSSLALGVSLSFSSPSYAASGDATPMAVPAVVPSPIKPTGEMAKVCNVVALGREDVCLEPKKPPSAYDKVLLNKELDTLGSSDPNDVLKTKLLKSVLESEWEICEQTIEQIPKEQAARILAKPLKSLRTALKEGDGPTAVKSVLEISKKL